jgi:hypothetical protein
MSVATEFSHTVGSLTDAASYQASETGLQQLPLPNSSTQSNTASSLFLGCHTQSNTQCKLSTAWWRAEKISGMTVNTFHISGQRSHLTRMPTVLSVRNVLNTVFPSTAWMNYLTNKIQRNMTFRGPCIVIYSYNKSQPFLNFIFDKELYMFQTDLLSIIRSLNPSAPEYSFKF